MEDPINIRQPPELDLPNSSRSIYNASPRWLAMVTVRQPELCKLCDADDLRLAESSWSAQPWPAGPAVCQLSSVGQRETASSQ